MWVIFVIGDGSNIILLSDRFVIGQFNNPITFTSSVKLLNKIFPFFDNLATLPFSEILIFLIN